MSTTAPSPLQKPGSVDVLLKQRQRLRDLNRERVAKMGTLDRIALWITAHVGSMGFFLLIAAWTFVWLMWNFLAPARLQFDPPMAFVFWLFISNMIQILLMPLIMVGQNLQSQHAETRAEYDLEVNVRAEREIEAVLRHLEYQNGLLIAMLEKLGVNIDEALHKSRR
jgi:uncharacterized membrane protein